MSMKDDNRAILDTIKERMKIGEKRYGHGIRIHDDTRQWDTEQDSWIEMALEEVLDLALYLAAQIHRIESLRIDENASDAVSPPKVKTKPRTRRYTRLFRWLR
jgi:hypothetical protein